MGVLQSTRITVNLIDCLGMICLLSLPFATGLGCGNGPSTTVWVHGSRGGHGCVRAFCSIVGSPWRRWSRPRHQWVPPRTPMPHITPGANEGQRSVGDQAVTRRHIAVSVIPARRAGDRQSQAFLIRELVRPGVSHARNHSGVLRSGLGLPSERGRLGASTTQCRGS